MVSVYVHLLCKGKRVYSSIPSVIKDDVLAELQLRVQKMIITQAELDAILAK